MNNLLILQISKNQMKFLKITKI